MEGLGCHHRELTLGPADSGEAVRKVGIPLGRGDHPGEGFFFLDLVL